MPKGENKRLKIPQEAIEKYTINGINFEVTDNKVKSTTNTIKELKEKGKIVKRFYYKDYDANEIYETVDEVVISPRKNASTRLASRRKAVLEFLRLG
ncbi:hypothetical protein SULI_12525 [Saccharolobus solfataricus]|uniref:ORF2 in transposon ISC1058 n=1 Tax=Saccharolobus solfataricus TaxID=2287 RepID=A0A157T294_SACSO|nr:hypothetical protein [Saccharolobus solfataricus]AYN75618.1 hypothetical protein SULB_03695 [Saccharolobus solfataricus]AYN75780.1 hypothetical protein SULC_03685 [Saccharolobus solfataricus]AYP18615.1 hypothetical protein SULA_03695 [Saccharolobus solfataricus]AZF69075.1 hypothetical protein SULG_12525 [Saccharolobus solfataricus]AZF71695.1 hypothetical protein SULH_12525 [Saccharolobus solfataricus]